MNQSMSTTDLAICAALERLADENAQSARTARQSGDKDDARFFQRAANAYTKALLYYRGGLRPMETPNGYILPSQRPGQESHFLTKDGDWRCTCPAGDSMHWASALIIGIEVAGDMLDSGDVGDDAGATPSGDDDTPPPAGWPCDTDGQPLDWYAAKAAVENGSVRSLGQRIADARRAQLRAA